MRLDDDRVVRAFSDAWRPGSVVLVEGSDLVRADLAARFASDDQAVKIRAHALAATDRIVGRLLDHVDAGDMVMVVAPTPPGERDALSVAAVRAPGFTPGLLRSTTTQRDGFVNLTDVAPTILTYFGLDRPDAMEGRRMETGDAGGSLAERSEFLVNVNEDGLFRDGLIGSSMGVIVGVACALAVAAAVVDRWRRGAGLLVFGALWLLGYLVATYLAGPLHFGRNGGAAAYWAFVIGVGAVIAAVCMLATRRRPVDAALAGLGTVVAVHLVDLVTGAHLEWNTVFGYSPTIGIRFVGQGNMTFSQLTAAAVLFAGVLAWRVPTARGIRVAIGLLAVTVVVMGVPFWGNDFGGAISAAPGFALLAWLLLGKELRWRTVWMLLGVLVASGVVVGLVDLLRPSDQRTHVGKFFEKAGTDFGSATLVLRRKASENLSVLTHSLLLGCIIAAALLLVYLWLVPPRSLTPLLERVTTARADRPRARRRRRPRLRVERLGHHDPGHDGRGVRERARDPAGAGGVHRYPESLVTVVVAILVGIVTVRFLRIVSGEILSSPALERQNYRGRTVATAGGLFIILSVLIIDAGRSVLGAIGVGAENGLTEARTAVLFAVFGFGFLGLVDDLTAVGSDRGFKGHVGALREGRVTTGMLKLVGGAAVAVVLVATPGFKSGRTLIVDAMLIALAANLGNLLDRAPGRTIKFGLVAYVPIAIAIGTAPIGIAVAPVMGAAFGLLGDDLHERLMLGDTGANVIGAVLGLAVVLGSRDSIRLGVMLRVAGPQRRRRARVVQPGDRRGPAAALVRPTRHSSRTKSMIFGPKWTAV